MLKRVSPDGLPKLSGVIDGLAAEVLNDDSVEIDRLDRTGKGVKADPFLYWKKGVVAERSSTRGMNLDCVLTPGRSQGLFVSKTLRELVLTGLAEIRKVLIYQVRAKICKII